MTRDEALRIAHEKWTKEGTKCSESIVDILSALGILKLDEPLSIEERLNQASRQVAISSPIGGWGYVPPAVILQIAAEAGLRIVEK